MVEYKEEQERLSVEDILKKAMKEQETLQKAELLTRRERLTWKRVIAFLENAVQGGKKELLSGSESYAYVKSQFEVEVEKLEDQTEFISKTLQNVFDFMEAAFGESQEMVAFITELNANYYSVWFIKENGSDQYYRYNRGLLFDERHKALEGRMDAMEELLNKGIR